MNAVADPRASRATPEEKLSRALGELTRWRLRLGRELGRARGMTLPQVFLLAGLVENARIPVTRWAEVTGSSPSTTTALLDGLEDAGLVRREHDEEDRRQVLVSLTPKGLRIAEEFRREGRRQWEALCRGIPAAELDRSSATLRRILLKVDPEPAEDPLRPPLRSERWRNA
ncbi:MAG: MarR family transcriptional regulator [Euryarchaeota archaeon]|nr:MarR family transcriptional regulator [Euryarchaeota archaeon]MDE1835609.1 MarR family transcriptional regulator [Euryarchaeota archaeon]MDE1878957.1 MarR family transcriptional regulator [Euryarchaeota archaeon]MDE2043769.1 MarR family transcriptional regulator [Thermoplasmata archaeon]